MDREKIKPTIILSLIAIAKTLAPNPNFLSWWKSFTYIIAGMGLLTGCARNPSSWKGTPIEPPIIPADFVLNDQHGHLFQLSKQQGRVVLLFFGFSHCPNVCPTTLSLWRQTIVELGSTAENVCFVFITVDPRRDTSDVLKSYLANYHDRIVGLTGNSTELDSIYKNFGIFAESGSNNDSSSVINHTTSMLLLDKLGRWRLNHSGGAAVADLVHDIKLLMSEKI